jgi:hypothetical protein
MKIPETLRNVSFNGIVNSAKSYASRGMSYASENKTELMQKAEKVCLGTGFVLLAYNLYKGAKAVKGSLITAVSLLGFSAYQGSKAGKIGLATGLALLTLHAFNGSKAQTALIAKLAPAAAPRRPFDI